MTLGGYTNKSETTKTEDRQVAAGPIWDELPERIGFFKLSTAELDEVAYLDKNSLRPKSLVNDLLRSTQRGKSPHSRCQVARGDE